MSDEHDNPGFCLCDDPGGPCDYHRDLEDEVERLRDERRDWRKLNEGDISKYESMSDAEILVDVIKERDEARGNVERFRSSMYELEELVNSLRAELHSHPDREKLIRQLRADLKQLEADNHELAASKSTFDIQ